MIRLSANLGFMWPDRPLLDRIEAAARAGFGAVELHWPYDTPATEVAACCKTHGVKLLAINTVKGQGRTILVWRRFPAVSPNSRARFSRPVTTFGLLVEMRSM